MKRKGLMALAVAGALGFTSAALAGPGKHASTHEVISPSSVSESAPWLAGQSQSSESADSISTAGMSGHESEAIGASSSEGGSGSGGFSSGELSAADEDFSGAAM